MCINYSFHHCQCCYVNNRWNFHMSKCKQICFLTRWMLLPFRLCLESRRQPKYKMAKVNSGKERVPLLMSVLCLFFIFIQRMRICKPENNSYTILFFEIYFLRSVNISYKINDMPFWMTRYCSVFRYLNTQSLLQYCN